MSMRSNLVRWTLPLVAGGALLITQGVAAQAPAADTVACDLAPLELPLFGGTPASIIATPRAEATPGIRDVSLETMQDAMEQYVACTNTGDPVLVWAMFTPRLLASAFVDPEVHYLPAFEQMLDSPGWVVEFPLELVNIDRIDQLTDGRVDVAATFLSGDEEWTDTLTLALVDGRWLVDDVRLNTPAE